MVFKQKISQQTTSVVGKHKATQREKATKTEKSLNFPDFNSEKNVFF